MSYTEEVVRGGGVTDGAIDVPEDDGDVDDVCGGQGVDIEEA